MAKQKLTTEEILAKARQQGAFGSGGSGNGSGSAASSPANKESEPAAVESPPEAQAEEAKPTAAPAAKKPAAKPGSTADILAAARAQGASGGGEKPSPAAKPAAKPGSTSDILAAARAQGSAGAVAAKKPSPKPGSTADILAAARAGGASGVAAKTSAKPAASKASAAKTAVARPSGERPSVQEMVKAARSGAPVAAQAAAAKPKLPARPPVPARKTESSQSRRSFFSSAFAWLFVPLTLAWVALTATGGTFLLAVARFMMPNVIVEPPTRFKIGPPSDYPPGTVSTKWKAARGVWIVHTSEYDGRNLIYALASVCTHLGCTPNWLEGEQKFKCPCHGSGFYITGVNFEGPAPRPLERLGLRLAEDGSLEVDKSVKFQEELGQWQDPASYVELA